MSLGLKKALIVTDKMLVKIGLIDKLTGVFGESSIDYPIFYKTQPNPTVKNIEDGLTILKENNCDFIISFGGGSPHDCTKGIGIVASNGGCIKNYEGVNKSKKSMFQLVAINTTAGTASKMTKFCIITDEDRHIKMTIVDNHTTPTVSINDPLLIIEKPASLTAATGMSALTHAIEAFVSTQSTPITGACVLMAI